jgi:phosphomannomutase
VTNILFDENSKILGKLNKEISLQTAITIGIAFGNYLKSTKPSISKIAIGSDMRIASKMFGIAISLGIASCGIDVVDISGSTLSMLSYSLKKTEFNLGILVSNIVYEKNEYIAINILNSYGEYLDPHVTKIIEDFFKDPNYLIDYTKRNVTFGNMSLDLEATTLYSSFLKAHIDFNIPDDKRVVIYSANEPLKKTLNKLFNSRNVIVVSETIDASSHSEISHLNSLRKLVIKENAFIGIYFNDDTSEITLVDRYGTKIDYDKVAAILAMKYGKNIGTSYYASKIIERFLINRGLNILRSNNKNGIFDLYKNKDLDFIIDINGIIIDQSASVGDNLLTAILILKEYIINETHITKLISSIPEYSKVYTFLSLPSDREKIINDRNSVLHKYGTSINKKERIDFTWYKKNNKLKIFTEAKTYKKAYEIAHTACEILKKNLNNIDNF